MWKARCAEHFAEEPVVAPHSRFHPVPTRPVFSPPPAEELAALFAPKETPPATNKAANAANKPPAEATPTDPTPTVKLGPLAPPSDRSDVGSTTDPTTSTQDGDAHHESDGNNPPVAPDNASPQTLAPPDVEPDEAAPTRTAIRTKFAAALHDDQFGDSAADDRAVHPTTTPTKPTPVHSTFARDGADARKAADAHPAADAPPVTDAPLPEEPLPDDVLPAEAAPAETAHDAQSNGYPLHWRVVPTPAGSLRATPADDPRDRRPAGRMFF